MPEPNESNRPEVAATGWVRLLLLAAVAAFLVFEAPRVREVAMVVSDGAPALSMIEFDERKDRAAFLVERDSVVLQVPSDMPYRSLRDQLDGLYHSQENQSLGEELRRQLDRQNQDTITIRAGTRLVLYVSDPSK